ncbi:MAG: hypothetical protein ABIF71_03145 [Planctomycetota bacterium]
MRILTGLGLVATIVVSAAAQDGVEGEYSTDLMREVRLEQSFRTGLNMRGISGCLLTSRTESVYEGGLIAGVGGMMGSTAMHRMDDMHVFGLTAGVAYGLAHDLFGSLANLEVSASLPLLVRNDGNEVTTGVGDAIVSVKVQILEEQPLRESVPSISLVLSGILPTGADEFTTVDAFGGEIGLILGKDMPAYETFGFRVYLEFIAAAINTTDGQDLQLKGNAALVMTLVNHPGYNILLEYGLVEKTAGGVGDSSSLACSGRYLADDMNVTAGFIVTTYDVLETRIDRQFRIAYERKFK